MIEISESKYDKMAAYVEEILSSGGKLMSCLEGLGNESYNERGRYGNKDDRYDDDRYMYGDRGRSGMRRYPNY